MQSDYRPFRLVWSSGNTHAVQRAASIFEYVLMTVETSYINLLQSWLKITQHVSLYVTDKSHFLVGVRALVSYVSICSSQTILHWNGWGLSCFSTLPVLYWLTEMSNSPCLSYMLDLYNVSPLRWCRAGHFSLPLSEGLTPTVDHAVNSLALFPHSNLSVPSWPCVCPNSPWSQEI